MGKLKSIKSKMLWARVFKLAFYGIGFPLLLWFLREEKLALGSGYVMGSSGNYIVYFGLIAWAIVLIGQLIAHLFRSKRGRQIFATAVTLVVTLGSLVFCDLYVDKKITELNEKYGNQYVTKYEDQVVKFHGYAQSLEGPIGNFLATYNIDFMSSNKGKNTDGSEVKYDEEDDAYYSPNGLYADGYVFGYKAAKKVILTYYDARAAFAEEHPDVDIEDALAAALAAQDADPYSAWTLYKLSDEYLAAYGEDGTAKKYYVTPERLDAILSTLGKIASDNKTIQKIIDLVAGLGAIPGLNLGGIDLDSLAQSLKENLNENLNLKKVMEIVQAVAPTVTEDMIWELLAGYSFYQSPTTKPAFMFLEDEILRDYAWAKYKGITHGGKVGSILIPTANVNQETGEVSYSKVGCITLDASGSDAMSENELRDMFTRYEIAKEYMPQLYPLIAIRNMLILYGALCVLGVAVSYFFARIEQKQMELLSKAAREGGLK